MSSSSPATTLEFLNLATGYFTSHEMENARLNAELLLCGVMNLKRIDLYVQFDRALDAEQVTRYREHIRRRAAGEPVQYILGHTEFYGRPFRVTPAVLIPRPETEVLVERVLERIEGIQDPIVADIGTGSGVIAVTIAAERPDARVAATDISPDALAIARENAEANQCADRTDFVEGDLLAPFQNAQSASAASSATAPRFHAIVSNPPYVADSDRDTLQREVRDHEPGEALFAGPDGLAIIRRIVASAPEHTLPGGLVAMEVGAGQAQAVESLWREVAPDWSVEIARDLAGVGRIVVAQRPDDE